MKMLHIPYNNYKTQICKFFEQGLPCNFGKNCTYAHGKDELRKPYQELPTDAPEGMEITNPNAFRLLRTQIQQLSPRIVINENSDAKVKQQILDISGYFHENQKDEGLKML